MGCKCGLIGIAIQQAFGNGDFQIYGFENYQKKKNQKVGVFAIILKLSSVYQ
jgi:hypothetical protein